jgi:hypothetical protein
MDPKARGIETTVVFVLIARGATDFVTGATFAAGDIKISIDGAATANTTNLPSEIGNGLYKITLTAAEMDADTVSVTMVDQTSPKVFEDQGWLIATHENTYQAKVWYIDDENAAEDRYVAVFYRNGNVLEAGDVTSPQIQVYDVADGSDLVAAVGMVQAGTTDSFRHIEDTDRIEDGAAYVIKITATIDGASRQWLQPMGRDF